jgi:hypothetical protein
MGVFGGAFAKKDIAQSNEVLFIQYIGLGKRKRRTAVQGRLSQFSQYAVHDGKVAKIIWVGCYL